MGKIENRYNPDIVFPPGQTIMETLKAKGRTTVMELARELQVRPHYLCQVIDGELPITKELATGLERVLGIPASLWLNLEAHYREWKAKQK